jgi:hypothetical protein
MIEGQKKIIDYCGRLQETVKPANLPEIITGKIPPLTEEVRERELVVPVVGAFSSGKSSMLNTLMGTNVLPVAITPETSLATELHFSREEYIEAVKNDGGTVRYEVNEMHKLTSDAAKYAFARLYLNNKGLAGIEPLVLVDMPGFDSPLDAHNKAILVYLDRGCHYIILSSVEEGTVSKSLMRRMREIGAFDRGFNFFLSKSNLRSKETVNDLVRHYTETIRESFDNTEPVVPLDNNSADDVIRVLKSLNADSVFFNMYRERLNGLCGECIDALNIRISAANKGAAEIADAVKELEDSIEKMKKKADNDTADMERRYSGGMVNDIIQDVGNALESSLDELVAVASGGNQEETGRRINDIIRSALTISIKNKLESVNQQIIIDCSSSLQGLDKAMKALEIDDNYIQNLSTKIQTAFTDLQTVLASSSGPVISKGLGLAARGVGSTISATTILGGTGAAAGAAVAGGLAAATAGIALPVIGIALIFLPEILGVLFKGSNEQKQREAIRSKLAGEVIPNVKRKLRDEIPAILDPQIDAMIKQVREQYQHELEQHKAQIDLAIKDKKTNAEERKKERIELENIRSKVSSFCNEILTWGKV